MRLALWILATAALASAPAALPPICPPSSTVASWYGPGFAGRATASGEIFDPGALTAAHKTLPFGTRLLVCLDGCVVVRITDRGPFIPGRALDLSKEAARLIGLIEPGVEVVSVSRSD